MEKEDATAVDQKEETQKTKKVTPRDLEFNEVKEMLRKSGTKDKVTEDEYVALIKQIDDSFKTKETMESFKNELRDKFNDGTIEGLREEWYGVHKPDDYIPRD